MLKISYQVQLSVFIRLAVLQFTRAFNLQHFDLKSHIGIKTNVFGNIIKSMLSYLSNLANIIY